MLNKETKDKLVAYGFDVSKLEEAVKAESEVSLDVPTLKTEEEFSKLISEEDKNVFGKNRFDEGKKAFSEIYAKEFKKKHGVDVDGKDLDAVVDAFVASEIAKVSGSSAEFAAEKKLLQQKIAEAEANLVTKTAEFTTKLSSIEIDTKLKALVPKDSVIPADGVLSWYMGGRVLKNIEGSSATGVFVNGELLKDSVLNPISIEDDFKSFMDVNKINVAGGMGGGDAAGASGGSAKFKSLNEFNDWCSKQDPPVNPMSEEGQKLLTEKKDEAVSTEEFYNA